MRRIELKVITRAKKEGLQRLSENSYKIKLTTLPEKGKANKRIIELLSEYFGIKKRYIRIVSGEFNNRKIVEIS